MHSVAENLKTALELISGAFFYLVQSFEIVVSNDFSSK
jgi:hypothetical protein